MKNNKIKKSRREAIMDITGISLFAAICYVALALLFIPFANMYIHFGNLIVVLAALLIGGWQGGLAGSIGMGLFDMLNGHAESAPKTFILKFLIGLTVGVVFKLLSKKGRFPKTALIIAGAVSLTASGALAVYTLIVNKAFIGKGAVLCPIFLAVSVLCFIVALLNKKFSGSTACAVVAAFCGMMINIIGETLWRYFMFLFAGSSSAAALSAALLAQGSTLINAGLAIIGGVALFTVLKKPVGKIRGF